jgi:hypothetical protein
MSTLLKKDVPYKPLHHMPDFENGLLDGDIPR